jgi:hypothetical protein
MYRAITQHPHAAIRSAGREALGLNTSVHGMDGHAPAFVLQPTIKSTNCSIICSFRHFG